MKISWKDLFNRDPEFIKKLNNSDQRGIGIFYAIVNFLPALALSAYLSIPFSRLLHADQFNRTVNQLAAESGPFLGRFYILLAAILTGCVVMLLFAGVILFCYLLFPLQARLFYPRQVVEGYTRGVKLPGLAWYDRLCFKIIDLVYPSG